MGIASFSFQNNPEQIVEDMLFKMKDEYKEAMFNALLKDNVKGTVWGLLDGKYHEYLEESDKQLIADECVNQFVDGFNSTGSDVWTSYESSVNAIVSKKVKEVVVNKSRS